MSDKISVGVIGLGMMGNTHLDVYAGRDDVEVVAVADLDERRLSGAARASGNIEGQAKGGFDLSKVAKFRDGLDLIAKGGADVIDICAPTPQHLSLGLAAIESGRHVLLEKPLARTHAEAKQLADAASRARGMVMCAMCMRFWPGWTWLKAAVDQSLYGGVQAATFRRVASHPGGGFYSNGDLCGGAILDLHIHDTDFVQWCFGSPRSVQSTGYTSITKAIDHVVTRYAYGDGGPMVVAEGGWAMAKGFGFQMQFTVNFREATAVFDLASKQPLTLYRDGKSEPVTLEEGMGYAHEIDYFLGCVARGEAPRTVTMPSAAESVRIVEAEVESIARGEAVSL
jgi:predicted dehydrogenase